MNLEIDVSDIINQLEETDDNASFSELVELLKLNKESDFRGSDFRNADLSECDLSGFNLSEADLSGASLIGSDLSDANLFHANLEKADLKSATITNTNFMYCNLKWVNLIGTKLDSANILFADLTGAKIEGGTIPDAQLAEMLQRSSDGLVDQVVSEVRLIRPIQECSSQIGSIKTHLMGIIAATDYPVAIIKGITSAFKGLPVNAADAEVLNKNIESKFGQLDQQSLNDLDE
jgi:uncharacterized protein YjbI with pentapeptide repeats